MVSLFALYPVKLSSGSSSRIISEMRWLEYQGSSSQPVTMVWCSGVRLLSQVSNLVLGASFAPRSASDTRVTFHSRLGHKP